MNILIPVQGFSPSGGSRVLSNLATEWVKLGHRVVFLSPESDKPVYFPTKASIIWFNSDGQIVGNPKKFLHRLTPAKYTKALRKAIKRKANDFDIVLLNHCYTVWPALLAGERKKCFYYIQLHEPEVFFSHASDLYGKVEALFLWVTYFLIPKSKCFVNSEIYIDYKGIRTTAPVIPPGIDLGLYRAKDFSSFVRKIVFGVIGRKEPWKGTGQAIDALRLMITKGWDVSLYVAYGNISEEMINGIEQYVKIVTPENDKELSDFYRSVDIMLALGTIQHGAPHYPVIESMACGTMVITTGYFPADGDTSYIVPENDPEAVAKAVEIIVHEDDSVIRNKIYLAREKVLPLSWDALASKMINHIEKEHS